MGKPSASLTRIEAETKWADIKKTQLQIQSIDKRHFQVNGKKYFKKNLLLPVELFKRN
jgi:hypothetical protein